MKKYITFIGLILIGLLIGWLLFSNSTQTEKEHNHTESKENNKMWTCSMHPQIMKNEPGDCPICGMDLIPAEVGSEGLAADQFKLTKNAMALANIQTTIVGKNNHNNNTIKLSGRIAENEEDNKVQVSYFSGRIEKLNISYTGEKVRKGQLLATVYSPELYAAQQELLTSASLKKTQPNLYKAVRNKLKIWKLSDEQINEIERSKKVKENFPIYATVSGTVTKKLVEKGDYIKQGQPLLRISNLQTVWANFDVYENQIDLLKIGQKTTITSNAFPNKKITGKVDFIDPILDIKKRTVTLRVVINNKKNLFKPGMFVSANIVNTKSKEALIIPASSVLWTGKRSVVYIKSNPKEPVFELRKIELGNKIGENYEIVNGLIAGDEIVTNGTFTVDAAAQLQGKKSMMNKSGGKTMTGHEGHLGMDNNNNNNKEPNHSDMINRIVVSNNFQKQLNTLFDSYIILKESLVNDSPIESKTAASKILDNLKLVDMKLLSSNEAHKHWMLLEKEIKQSSMAISNSKNIDEQRNHFRHLSSHLIKSLKLFGINKKVFVEFCPMANNNKGAFWLSTKEKISNPYYGQKMLTCGEIKQVIE
ncbi:MAG: efflux RND transporter periplasmic adaptor subunit [Flavobacteriaceae bacterium]